jgi:hypothetical protein
MYTSCVGRNDVTPEWIRKTDAFVERAFDEAAKGASLVPCPCSKCANMKGSGYVERLSRGIVRRRMYGGRAKADCKGVLRHV